MQYEAIIDRPNDFRPSIQFQSNLNYREICLVEQIKFKFASSKTPTIIDETGHNDSCQTTFQALVQHFTRFEHCTNLERAK